jgi:hypothetical protein
MRHRQLSNQKKYTDLQLNEKLGQAFGLFWKFQRLKLPCSH